MVFAVDLYLACHFVEQAELRLFTKGIEHLLLRHVEGYADSPPCTVLLDVSGIVLVLLGIGVGKNEHTGTLMRHFAKLVLGVLTFAITDYITSLSINVFLLLGECRTIGINTIPAQAKCCCDVSTHPLVLRRPNVLFAEVRIFVTVFYVCKTTGIRTCSMSSCRKGR